jgi:3-isopropylmalate/(R)-2-methylmalate dehydratase small subunit
MLPIVIDEKKIEELAQYFKRKENLEINLKNQEIIFGNKRIQFEIDSFKKKCLLNGLDDIAMTLEKTKEISSFENKNKKNKPWLS